MRKLLFAGLLMLLLVPLLAMGQSPLDGTWKNDLSKAQFPTKPDVYVLQNGMFECKTCVPPINVKADGTDQKLTGDPYSDALSVKVFDDHNVETTNKKAGKVMFTGKNTISPDGNTLIVHWTDSSQPSGGTQVGTYTATRVDKGPAGAHLISGSWRGQKQEASDTAVTFTLKVNGDMLTMNTLTGQSYTAKLDGTDAPYKGDPGTTSVSVKMLDKNTLEETDKRDGKAIYITKMTVPPNGKTMKIIMDDKLEGRTTKGDATKQ